LNNLFYWKCGYLNHRIHPPGKDLRVLFLLNDALKRAKTKNLKKNIKAIEIYSILGYIYNELNMEF
jgi:hypothetical protein